jgi:hypothetical protein
MIFSPGGYASWCAAQQVAALHSGIRELSDRRER